MSWLEALRSVSHNTMGWLAASNESEIAFDRCAFRCIMHVTCCVHCAASSPIGQLTLLSRYVATSGRRHGRHDVGQYLAGGTGIHTALMRVCPVGSPHG